MSIFHGLEFNARHLRLPLVIICARIHIWSTAEACPKAVKLMAIEQPCYTKGGILTNNTTFAHFGQILVNLSDLGKLGSGKW